MIEPWKIMSLTWLAAGVGMLVAGYLWGSTGTAVASLFLVGALGMESYFYVHSIDEL